MPLTVLAFWMAYVGGICAAMFNPLIGVMLYVLVYHLNPETQWWGSSVQALGLRTSFTVALATAIGMVIRMPRFEFGAKQFPAIYILAIVLASLAVASLAWGVDVTDRGEYQAEKFVKLMIIMFIVIRCVRRPVHYHYIILAWLVGVLYLGYEATGGVGTNRGGRLTAGLGGPDFAESSGLAVHLVATLPLIGAVFFMARSWLGRSFALVTGALAVNTIIMTRTRNAIPGLAAMAFTTVLSLPRGYRLKGVVAVVAGTFMAVHLTDPGWWERMNTLSAYKNDHSAMQRLELWKAAFEMVDDYPFGIGLGNFHHVAMEYIPGLRVVRSAHSTPMACMAELGWPGLAVYVTIILMAFWRLGQARRTANGLPAHVDVTTYRWHARFHLGWHATALRSALAGYVGCSLFTTRMASEDFWLLIALVGALGNIGTYMVNATEAERNPARAAAVLPTDIADSETDPSEGARPHASPVPPAPANG